MATATKTKTSRRWKTISLRGLMLLVVLVGIVLARETNLARRQKHAIDVIRAAGGTVAFDDVVKLDGGTGKGIPPNRSAWQRWLMRTLGDDYVRTVRHVQFDIFTPRDRRATRLSQEVLSALGEFPALVSLYVEQMNVTDSDLATVKSLHHLRHLDVQGNRELSDAGLAHLENLSNLTVVLLTNTAVSDEGIRHLRNSTGLAHLRAGHTFVGDGTLALVGQKPKMLALDLSVTRVTDAGMPHLRKLKYLRVLDLSETEITDLGLAHVAGLTTLQVLYLNDTPTSDASLAHLARLTSLQGLSLGRNVTDASLPILKSMKKLMTLHVTSSKISPEGARELKKALPSTNIIR